MNTKFNMDMSERVERKFRKVVVIMPVYNAELTLEKTFRNIP